MDNLKAQLKENIANLEKILNHQKKQLADLEEKVEEKVVEKEEESHTFDPRSGSYRFLGEIGQKADLIINHAVKMGYGRPLSSYEQKFDYSVLKMNWACKSGDIFVELDSRSLYAARIHASDENQNYSYDGEVVVPFEEALDILDSFFHGAPRNEIRKLTNARIRKIQKMRNW